MNTRKKDVLLPALGAVSAITSIGLLMWSKPTGGDVEQCSVWLQRENKERRKLAANPKSAIADNGQVTPAVPLRK